MNNPVCYLNQQWMPHADAALPGNDLGLQRGYAIFDFLRVAENVPLYIDDHLQRFYHSAAAMHLPVKESMEAFKSVIKEMIRLNDMPSSGIKILLTGGASADGYSIQSPNLLMVQQPLAAPPPSMVQPGYKLFTYEYQRELPTVKTTNYLMAIRLQPWLKEKGGDDVLYRSGNCVSECPRSNFFIVTKRNQLVTPSENILQGVTRKQLLGIAKENGMAVEEREVTLSDIQSAKEAFISSSTKRLIPVAQVDDIRFTALPNESVTHRLFNLFLQKEKQTIALG